MRLQRRTKGEWGCYKKARLGTNNYLTNSFPLITPPLHKITDTQTYRGWKTDSNGDMRRKDKRDSSAEGSLMGKDKEKGRKGGMRREIKHIKEL